tara:strand:- start:2983 stop:3750 length:768 start_codon:yes stop_codon:yes gene_type:complete
MKIKDITNHKLFIPSIKKVNELSKNIKNLGGSVPHNHHHILFVIKELLGSKCKNYLEIGVAAGGSMLNVMQSKYKTKYYGIDLFNHMNGYLTYKEGETILQRITTVIDTLNVNKHEYTLIEGDSMDPSTSYKIKMIKGGIDLFYIDGNHTQVYVNNDFSVYEKYVNKGGVIVFDDNVVPAYNLIPSNYTYLGKIPREAYILHNDQLQQTNISSSGEVIYNYKGRHDDVKNIGTWQKIIHRNDFIFENYSHIFIKN